MNPDDLKLILDRIDSLEERISQLELNKVPTKEVKSKSNIEPVKEVAEFSDLNISVSAPFESNLGEYGLAWLGNIVMFFAISFLWQYFNDAGKPLISTLVGVVSVVAVFLMSRYFRKNFTFLSFMFNLFGFIILFYIVLRMHYFTDKPFITNQILATGLLLLLIVFQIYTAFRKQSQILAALAFTFALITAYASRNTHSFFVISIGITCVTLYAYLKFNWWKALTIVLITGFIVSMIWLLKNPVSLVKNPDDLTYHYAFTYLSVLAGLYSLVVFRKPDNSFSGDSILSTILIAGISYSMLVLAIVVKHFPNSFVPFFVSISVYCLVYSVILKLYSPWKYTPSLYALYGFVSISVSVFGIYHFPDSFLLLIYQSVLVLVLALWYRSQIITLMNTVLLLILIIVYYKVSGTLQIVNFSIPVVAFLSARIIKWQKERLNIKTDFIRNIYLFTLFFTFLIATYKGLPGQYITVSWLAISGIYFVLSILIKSIKYRWMAMGNLLISAFYLFLFDLANIDLIYRVLAFLAFAIISIIFSTYYVKKLKRNDSGSPTVEG
ncbi:MAG: hypothetical protein HOO86_17515 [Bacteroidales bacterium]|nr:hypothetical protein [Bacteroidales bacterium]